MPTRIWRITHVLPRNVLHVAHDKVLIATYSNNNSVLSELGVKDLNANKYQLVEKIVIKLPKKFRVVVDEKYGWFYYFDKGKWYGIDKDKYSTPPFEY